MSVVLRNLYSDREYEVVRIMKLPTGCAKSCADCSNSEWYVFEAVYEPDDASRTAPTLVQTLVQGCTAPNLVQIFVQGCNCSFVLSDSL